MPHPLGSTKVSPTYEIQRSNGYSHVLVTPRTLGPTRVSHRVDTGMSKPRGSCDGVSVPNAKIHVEETGKRWKFAPLSALSV